MSTINGIGIRNVYKRHNMDEVSSCIVTVDGKDAMRYRCGKGGESGRLEMIGRSVRLKRRIETTMRRLSPLLVDIDGESVAVDFDADMLVYRLKFLQELEKEIDAEADKGLACFGWSSEDTVHYVKVPFLAIAACGGERMMRSLVARANGVTMWDVKRMGDEYFNPIIRSRRKQR